MIRVETSVHCPPRFEGNIGTVEDDVWRVERPLETLVAVRVTEVEWGGNRGFKIVIAPCGSCSVLGAHAAHHDEH